MDKNFKVVRRSNWLVVVAALGFTGYTAYRLYHLPSIARNRAKISKFFAALSSAAAAFSDSADCIATISKDLKQFLHSDSDEIPHSLKQISKLARCDEVSDSFTRLSQAFTLGVLRGYDQYYSRRLRGGDRSGDDWSSLRDKIMGKLCSESGSGFVSVVVGSFARNLVMAFFSMEEGSKCGGCVEVGVARWMGVACDEKCRELIGEVVRMLVSTAVAVYLEKTMEMNTFDQIFSGLTNPNHEREMRDLLVSLSNGAVKTLIRTSHQVMSGKGGWAIEAGPGPGPETGKKTEEFEDVELGLKPEGEFGGWPSERESKVKVGSKRKVMVNLTGRMTFEMARWFLGVLLEKIYEGMKRCVDIVNEEVIERGMEMVRYVGAKTSVIAGVCLSLCLHVLDTTSCVLLPY